MIRKFVGAVGFLAALAPALAFAGPAMPHGPLAAAAPSTSEPVARETSSDAVATDALLRDGDAAKIEKAYYYYRVYRYRYYRPYYRHYYYRPYYRRHYYFY